ncbi:MAG: MFS transporter [Acidobacteria bacterium]|nr:MFS transporter [Acidobacteriota bacterium]
MAFYTLTTYLHILAKGTLKDNSTFMTVNFFALLIFMVLQPVYGMISDKIGRNRCCCVSALAVHIGAFSNKGPTALDEEPGHAYGYFKN